jgi:hypothetical protein
MSLIQPEANPPANPPAQPLGPGNQKRRGRPWGTLNPLEGRRQGKEVMVVISLILVRMHMISYVDALNSTSADKTHALKVAIKALALQQRWITEVPYLFVIGLLLLALLLRVRIPRRWLDVSVGAFITINLIFHFLKINLLLFTPPAAINLLIGQILTYLVFFVLAWGWIFWRVDWVNQAKPGTVIVIADAGEQVSMFDYFHASLMTIVRHSTSEVVGKNRNGQILVAIHTLMLLDLFAVALGRFYQIITKII